MNYLKNYFTLIVLLLAFMIFDPLLAVLAWLERKEKKT